MLFLPPKVYSWKLYEGTVSKLELDSLSVCFNFMFLPCEWKSFFKALPTVLQKEY